MKSESGRPVGACGCSAEAARGWYRFCFEGQQAGLVDGLQGGGGLGREWRITLRFWLSGWEEGGAVYRDGDPRGRRNGVSGTGQTSSRFAHITTRPVARGLAVCGP